MRRAALGIALPFVLCGGVFGNVGAFFGSGHSLRLVRSADVRMVSEDVTITPIFRRFCNDALGRIPLYVWSEEPVGQAVENPGRFSFGS